MMIMNYIRIGACSWKYPSWVNLVYSKAKGINYLFEYAEKYNTVEIDQWFWSLFQGSKPALPKESTVNEYNQSVPEDFKFTIKAPNSITLTHYYKSRGDTKLVENPYFLSAELWSEFIKCLEPIHNKIGLIMLQFEYLNKMKMSSLNEFLKTLSGFISIIPDNFKIAVEIRNPQYLKEEYFKFLNRHNIYHVFLQGYFMPDITQYYPGIKEYIKDCAVIRLHGNDRKGIEERTKRKYVKRVDLRDDEINKIVKIINELIDKHVNLFVNVNNHYEGSAPLTIGLLQSILNDVVI